MLSGQVGSPIHWRLFEQITYLMFLRRLEDIQTAKERKATRTRSSIENPVYTDDTKALRWSSFSDLHPDHMIVVVRDAVFPWLRTLGGDDTTYSQHMKEARFTIPTANLLTKAVDMLDNPSGRGGH